jgi:filamentous hemagglutinin
MSTPAMTATSSSDASGAGNVTMGNFTATADDILVQGYNVQVDRLVADWSGAFPGGAVMTGAGDITITATNNVTANDTLTAGTDATSDIAITGTEGLVWQTAGDMTAGNNVTIIGGSGVTLDGTIGTAIAIGNTVALTSTAGTVDIGGNITAMNNVTATAEESIILAAGLTVRADAAVANNAGDITFTADSNNDRDGVISLATTSTLAAEHITLVGENITAGILTADIAGNGAGNVTATAANNATFNGAVNAGNLTGTITLTGTEGTVTTAVGGTLNAGGNITSTAGLDSTFAALITATEGAVTLTSGRNLTTTAAGDINGNSVAITGTTGDVTLNGTVLADTTTVAILAGDDMTLNDTVTAQTNVTLTTENGNANVNAAVLATTGFITATTGLDFITAVAAR